MPRRFGRDEDDNLTKIKARLRGMLGSRDYDEIERLLDALTPQAEDDRDPADPLPPRPFTGAQDSRLAMDSAGPGAREAAIAMVAPYVGRDTVLACDTAAEVVRGALAALGYDAREIHASGLQPLWDMARRNHMPAGMGGGGAIGGGRPVHRDARDVASFAARFPSAARIRTV
jgi:hypothetical protein